MQHNQTLQSIGPAFSVVVKYELVGVGPAIEHGSVMSKQRRKGSRHPLLVKLMQFAVRDPKLARKLVKDHPEVLKLRTGLGETALHYLAVENCADAVQLLINLGAEVNVTNGFGASALEEAMQVEAQETIEVLRRAGAVA